MKKRALISTLAIVTAASTAALLAGPAGTKAGERPQVKAVVYDTADTSYVPLLSGPPETASMRSGLVTLAPGASVGKHSTEGNEEMLVPIEGEGELRITGQPTIKIRPGLITYAPAHTEHDVFNTGTSRLRYIYIVARAR